MTQPVLRVVAGRDLPIAAPPVSCRCDRCRDEERPARTTLMVAAAGVVVGTLIPFAWNARGMIEVLASMLGVKL
jgi:hypothetical protein